MNVGSASGSFFDMLSAAAGTHKPTSLRLFLQAETFYHGLPKWSCNHSVTDSTGCSARLNMLGKQNKPSLTL